MLTMPFGNRCHVWNLDTWHRCKRLLMLIQEQGAANWCAVLETRRRCKCSSEIALAVGRVIAWSRRKQEATMNPNAKRPRVRRQTQNNLVPPFHKTCTAQVCAPHLYNTSCPNSFEACLQTRLNNTSLQNVFATCVINKSLQHLFSTSLRRILSNCRSQHIFATPLATQFSTGLFGVYVFSTRLYNTSCQHLFTTRLSNTSVQHPFQHSLQHLFSRPHETSLQYSFQTRTPSPQQHTTPHCHTPTHHPAAHHTTQHHNIPHHTKILHPHITPTQHTSTHHNPNKPHHTLPFVAFDRLRAAALVPASVALRFALLI